MDRDDNWDVEAYTLRAPRDDDTRIFSDILSIVSPNHFGLSYSEQTEKEKEVWKLLKEWKKSKHEIDREWEKNEKKRQERIAKELAQQKKKEEKFVEKVSTIVVTELRKYISKLSINGWKIVNEDEDEHEPPSHIKLKVSLGKEFKRLDIKYRVPNRPNEIRDHYLEYGDFRQDLSDKLFSKSNSIIKNKINFST